MNNHIYLDNAATTKMFKTSAYEMTKYYSKEYGNPSAKYGLGVKSREAVEESRAKVASLIGALPKEIYFTSGGSESDNWALKHSLKYNKKSANERTHIITSQIEHHAILNCCKSMEKNGARITYVNTDKDGVVNLSAIKKSITAQTKMISIMYANNEIGTIQPIDKISEIAKEYGILFHTDAVQATGHIPIDVKKFNIDMLSASAHKFNGPKGIGFLYINSLSKIEPMIYGGSQEKNLRAGTENVPAIVGMGISAQISKNIMEEEMKREKNLRDYFVHRIMSEISGVYYNGAPENRLPNNASFCFSGIEGEALIILLDMEGISVSGGAACTSNETQSSHVLTAIGRDTETARGALRVTLGIDTTKAELDYTIFKINNIVKQLRT